MACIYKVITLQTNEQVVLPPGAEIISASGGLESFTSTCPKPSELPPYVCYRFRTPVQGTDVDGGNNEHRIIGFRIGGIQVSINPYYNTPGHIPLGTSPESQQIESSPQLFMNRLAANIWNQLQSGNGLLISGIHCQYTNDNTNGDIVEVFIRTIKSDNVRMVMQDINNQQTYFFIDGIEGYCSAPESQGVDAGKALGII